MFLGVIPVRVVLTAAFSAGDLHPGNVLVSDDCKFILLDVGIVTQHSPSDHRLISDVLAAFIRCDGRRAGKLMSESWFSFT
jgi:predicted unusual protein kinase regulating ubiquinone biosynthesis (AarF/ABC1/UbiB family)